MAKNIQVAKIVASSTPAAWSQAYHAGTLTAVLSVAPKEKEDATSLHIVGKDLLNTFESEYFTLENKNLSSIKHAVETTYKKSSDTHIISFIVTAAIQNTLYIVMAGNGNVFLLRKGKFGTLLEQSGEEPAILSSSGFLEDGDEVILTSPAFLKLVSKEKLLTTLSENSIHESAEMLTPSVHAATEGEAAAVFFLYEDDVTTAPHELSLEQSKDEKEPPKEKGEKGEEPIFSEPLNKTNVSPKRPSKLSHRRKLLLTIVIILVLVLGITSYIAIQRQKAMQQTALFNDVYPQAKQKYDEGTGLMELNEPLAHEDFAKAQTLLQNAKDKLPTSSDQGKQVADLLAKVQQALDDSSNTNAVGATKADASSSQLLSYALAHPDIQYISEDKNNIYTADDASITQINKSTQKSKVLVTNAKTWGSIGGMQPYLTNFYLLDTKAGVLKFSPSGSTFAKSTYFATGVSPDLSSAKTIAIDGSIWILESNGTILKFTKGKQDTFALSGLDNILSSPTQLITNVDDDNIYILDNGNSRIVVVDKTGKYVTQYVTGILKKATQLVVDEKNKTALFLANGNIYQITLK